MVTEHQMSERHACALVGLSRDTYRHVGQTSSLNVELRKQIVQTAHNRRRWGYRMIHDVLRPQYPDINHKRVYRIYTAEGLSIRKRKKTKRIGVRVPLVAAMAVNQTWSLDFVSDAIARPGAISQRIKCLTVADDFSHECVGITADFGIGGAYVTRLLDRAATFRGYPKEVRTDNGPEFTCRAFMTWTQKHGIKHILIEPGSPTQNAYIESFNGTFRDECLDENWFESLEQARQIIAKWRTDYNEIRPHSSCGRMPPATFAALNRQLTADPKQTCKTDPEIS
jgi:putative transposase